jgi:dephospho-CoA kinase
MIPGVQIPVIGLAGPTGAGKSTAARMLAELGCAVLDGDALARELTAPGSPVLARLAARFGEDILCKGGSLDRALLAERAFASEETRRDLNSITHPPLAALALTRAKALQGARAIVLDAAALLESELARACDFVILLTAPEALRLARILKRGGVSEPSARQRMAAQARMDFTPPAGVDFTVINTAQGEAVLRDAIEKAFEAAVSGAAGGAVDAGAGAEHGGHSAPPPLSP